VTSRGWDSQVCGGFSFHECATTEVFYTTITTTFSSDLTCCGIVHAEYKSIHHRCASCCERVGSREKANGQRYDKIRANFVLRLNKAASTKANLRKLEKILPNWFCV
jgi:hypothetical protein